MVTTFAFLFGLSLLVHEVKYYSMEGAGHFTEDFCPALGLHLPAAARVVLHAAFAGSAVAFMAWPHLWGVWAALTGTLVLLLAAYPGRLFNHLMVGLFYLAAIGLHWDAWRIGGSALTGTLQLLVILTLSLAGVHKLNRGFLDPGASSGLALPMRYFRSRGWPVPPLPHRAGQAAALGIALGEILLPVATLVPAVAPAAFVLWVGLMIAFGIVGPQDFAMAMLAGLVLFPAPLAGMPPLHWALLAAGAGGVGWLFANRLPQRKPWIEAVNTAVVVGVGTYLLVQVSLGVTIDVRVADAFAAYPWTTALLTAAFVLNAACPYLGLKVDGSLSMFSNLAVDGSNHLLFRRQLRWGTPRYVHVTRVDLPPGDAHAAWRTTRFGYPPEVPLRIGYVHEALREFRRMFPGARIQVTAQDIRTDMAVVLTGLAGEVRWYERASLFPIELPARPRSSAA